MDAEANGSTEKSSNQVSTGSSMARFLYLRCASFLQRAPIRGPATLADRQYAAERDLAGGKAFKSNSSTPAPAPGAPAEGGRQEADPDGGLGIQNSIRRQIRSGSVIRILGMEFIIVTVAQKGVDDEIQAPHSPGVICPPAFPAVFPVRFQRAPYQPLSLQQTRPAPAAPAPGATLFSDRFRDIALLALCALQQKLSAAAQDFTGRLRPQYRRYRAPANEGIKLRQVAQGRPLFAPPADRLHPPQITAANMP